MLDQGESQTHGTTHQTKLSFPNSFQVKSEEI